MNLLKAIERLEADTIYRVDMISLNSNKLIIKERVKPFYLKNITTLKINTNDSDEDLKDITFKDVHNDQSLKAATYESFKKYIETRDFKGW